MEEKDKTWSEIEELFSTEVIEQSKRTAKRWFIIWLITFLTLVGTNGVWIYMFNQYDYVSQDGSGVNTYKTDVNGDVNNGSEN